ncbi:hypothetical protein RN001_006237 [Aquatica leii]|uniref:Peroxisomal membrane protein 11C n=1 Tax=Aquatica leii TaxID=1421715 RepID=A0AAN7QKV5_9COLE|nr:hypothetical protein RN001_006237 [Aquatica leii]
MGGSSECMLTELCEVLNTYRGRDKLVRTLCYTSKLLGNLSSDETFSNKCQIFGSNMSTARTVFGLLNDFPALKSTLSYGFGKEEPDQFTASVSVVINICDQLFFGLDKIAWFSEINLTPMKNEKAWRNASLAVSGLSTYLTILRTFRYITLLQSHKGCVNGASDNSEVSKIVQKQQMELLSCLRLFLDLLQTINGLPAGFLWSSKMTSCQVNFIATVSSFIGLYQMFAK